MPHCDLREQRRHRRREQVRRGVAIHLEGFGILVGHDADLRILRQRIREVDHLVVDVRGDRRVGKARRDRLGDRLHRRAGGDLLCRSVRERNCDLTHGVCVRLRLASEFGDSSLSTFD